MYTVRLTDHSLHLNDQSLPCPDSGAALLNHLYRTRITDYPKYHKMDALCQLGFVASELLLQAETSGDPAQRACYGTADRAVLLFGRAGSLVADTQHQDTIRDPQAYYPSPSVFVYTLPNIVTGEIAIRNRYYGETDYILLPEPDPALMQPHIQALFLDPATQSALVGWVDRPAPDTFCASLSIIERQ